jgi:hypothetical protein
MIALSFTKQLKKLCENQVITPMHNTLHSHTLKYEVRTVVEISMNVFSQFTKSLLSPKHQTPPFMKTCLIPAGFVPLFKNRRRLMSVAVTERRTNRENL